MDAPTLDRTNLTPSVATTLDVLADELEVAGARCLALDRVIGQMMERLPDTDRAQMLQSLHGVDLLAQHLACLSGFARHMGQAVPAHLTVAADTAISGITLGALAQRMAAGLGGSIRHASAPAGDGDVDLF